MYSGDEFYGDDITSGPLPDNAEQEYLAWLDAQGPEIDDGPPADLEERCGSWYDDLPF